MLGVGAAACAQVAPAANAIAAIDPISKIPFLIILAPLLVIVASFYPVFVPFYPIVRVFVKKKISQNSFDKSATYRAIASKAAGDSCNA
jgi:hypothetical protein